MKNETQQKRSWVEKSLSKQQVSQAVFEFLQNRGVEPNRKSGTVLTEAGARVKVLAK